MAILKIGWDLFAGSTQAGTDSGIPAVLTCETAQKGKHYVQVQRLSDNQYWDWVAAGWQAGAPTDAENGVFFGSVSQRNIHPSIRRLSMRLPKELLDGVTAAGLKIWVYPDGGSATTYIQMNYLP